jgi:hypothetical protein
VIYPAMELLPCPSQRELPRICVEDVHASELGTCCITWFFLGVNQNSWSVLDTENSCVWHGILDLSCWSVSPELAD